MPTRPTISTHRQTIRMAAAALLAAAAALQPSAAGAATASDAVVGTWVTPNDKSHVIIQRQADGSYAGRIVWLKQPDYPADFENPALAGKPKIDRHNPKPDLRARPVLGLDVLKGFRYQPAQNNWDHGSCYDPEGGKTYNCKMWLTDGGKKLYVRGYVWIFHKTQVWTRLGARPGK
ncbi:DUF2147 domain-containing protein [Acidihalobacter prosperus]